VAHSNADLAADETLQFSPTIGAAIRARRPWLKVLDDFGTGYSSLAYLRNFPFDKIKIDRSFVRDMLVRKDCRAIVHAVVGLARSLGITTIIEGIETRKQFETPKADGRDEGRGYLFSKPMPEHEIPEFLAKTPRIAAAA
jgi:EAL domain-containing protein (putative c-di-GMP-specific phosphodiesterase class I)